MQNWLVFLPIFLGAGVCGVALHLERSRFRIYGFSPSNISAIALVFGLYGGLMAKDIWDKIAHTEATVAAETSAIRSLLRIAEALDPDESRGLRGRIAAFVEEEERQRNAAEPLPRALSKSTALQAIYNALAREEAIPDAAFRLHFLNSLENVRRARLERLMLRSSHISGTKLGVLFLFGFLTQAAIALSHAGDRRATIASVLLFSVAFSGSIFVAMTFDDPAVIDSFLSGTLSTDVR